MAPPGNTGAARRRANIRRAIIASLIILCLALFSGYFRESSTGPLHGAQSSAAGVMAPVQKITSRAMEPFRDGWNYLASWKDARDRADQLQAQVEELRAREVESLIRDDEYRQMEAAAGVGDEVSGYRATRARIYARSQTAWDRTASINIGRSKGVVANSPVMAGSRRGDALVGVVVRARSNEADVAFITDRRTQVGAHIQGVASSQGLLQRLVPGQLRMSGVSRSAKVEEGQRVLTAGWNRAGLRSIYPRNLLVGVVTGAGSQEVDSRQTIQVTPLINPDDLVYVTVLVPESDEALRRAQG